MVVVVAVAVVVVFVVLCFGWHCSSCRAFVRRCRSPTSSWDRTVQPPSRFAHVLDWFLPRKVGYSRSHKKSAGPELLQSAGTVAPYPTPRPILTSLPSSPFFLALRSPFVSVVQAAGLDNVTVSQFAVPLVLSPEASFGDIWEYYTTSSPLGVREGARACVTLQEGADIYICKHGCDAVDMLPRPDARPSAPSAYTCRRTSGVP